LGALGAGPRTRRSVRIGEPIKAVIGETFTWDDPENYCFGCSQQNARGLKLGFTRTARNAIRCDYEAPTDLAGAPGVLHGGIQATILDEVFGAAAHTAFDEHRSTSMVTAEFSLRYRRPVPVGEPLVIHGALLQIEGRNYFLGGRIENAASETLTVATGRWVLLDRVG
jgi:acyl-coenzyme A thioesterase PaaI-like protein